MTVEAVDRIGVRFINRLSIGTGRELGEYLTVLPPIPETIAPDNIVNTFSRLLIRDSQSDIAAQVFYFTQVDESGRTVVIDTDAFTAREFGPDADEIWLKLEELRLTKNRIFFGSITEDAAREFDR